MKFIDFYVINFFKTNICEIVHNSVITPIFDPVTDLDLITELYFLSNCKSFP